MLRVLPTYIICASAVSAMLTLFAISTHIGSWLARITLFFLPEHPQISAENAGSPAMLYGMLSAHFLWGLAAVYLFRNGFGIRRKPTETEK